MKVYKNSEQEEKKCAEYVKASKLRKEYSEATNIQDRGIYHYSEWLEAKIEANQQQSVQITGGQEFFEAIERTCDFIPLLDDMNELINALIKDNPHLNTLNQDKVREAAEKVVEVYKISSVLWTVDAPIKKLEKALNGSK